jgi:hypothetical protein
VPNEAPAKQVNIEDLIAEEADIDLQSIAHEMRTVWFPAPGSTKPSVFEVGKRWPALTNLLIMAIFPDEEEIRIYCYPIADDGAGNTLPLNQLPPPSRFTLSKFSPIYTSASMTSAVFARLVVNELRAVADEEEVAAIEEREAIAKFLRTLPDGYPCAQAALDIEAELHIEDDSEDDDDEVDEKAAAGETLPNGGSPTAS